MAKTKNKKEDNLSDNLVETNPTNNRKVVSKDPSEVLLERLAQSGSFFQRYRILSMIVGGVFVLAIASVMIYYYIQNQQEREAQEEMFAAVHFLEADSLNKAINGDGNYQGFKAIISDYGLSKSANLARFYLGVAYLKKGEFKKSIEQLEKFSSSDLLIQGRAYVLIGDAYSELNQFGEALKYYQKAVGHKPNRYFTPIYMMKVALMLELQKNYPEALKTYSTIVSEYPESSEVPNAKKYKAKLEAMTAK